MGGIAGQQLRRAGAAGSAVGVREADDFGAYIERYVTSTAFGDCK
jgi:hypothetical protein